MPQCWTLHEHFEIPLYHDWHQPPGPGLCHSFSCRRQGISGHILFSGLKFWLLSCLPVGSLSLVTKYVFGRYDLKDRSQLTPLWVSATLASIVLKASMLRIKKACEDEKARSVTKMLCKCRDMIFFLLFTYRGKNSRLIHILQHGSPCSQHGCGCLWRVWCWKSSAYHFFMIWSVSISGLGLNSWIFSFLPHSGTSQLELLDPTQSLQWVQ